MSEVNTLPSQEYLHECFNYDEVTGDLFWKIRPEYHFKNSRGFNSFNNRFAGKLASNLSTSKSYKTTRVTGNAASHRIIWKYHTGVDPVGVIDHINQDKLDNRIENLRDVSQDINCHNTRESKNNTSGVKGVSFDKRDTIWRAGITIRGNIIHLGFFKDKEDAIKARKEAEEKDWSHLEDITIKHNKSNCKSIDLSYLKECFIYDDGKLIWNTDRPTAHFKTKKSYDTWITTRAGKVAGSRRESYRIINLNNFSYREHRLIYWLCTGIEPTDDKVIDHINGEKLDNRIENLRLCSRIENSRNTILAINNTTGFKGVRLRKSGRFEARIRHEGLLINLGTFDTPELAHSAYCIASTELQGEYANHG